MKVLVFGTGIENSFVLALAEAGHKIYYYTDYLAPYPSFEDYVNGVGFANVEKVHDFFNYVDKVDAIVTFDCYGGDLLEFLKRKGYKTFGGGNAVELELDRKLLKTVLKSAGIPTADYKVVKGFKDIKPPAVVKLSIFRGSAETFKVINEAQKKNLETRLRKEFGEFLDSFEFIVEEVIDDDNLVEAGIDAVYNNGFQFPMLYGVEYRKGVYIGKVVESLSELPRGLQDTLVKLDVVLKKVGYKGFISTEEFINPKTSEHYFLDICIRPPYPLGLGYRYVIKNFADVVLKDAKPQYRGKYYVAVPLEFPSAKEYFTYVKFPEEDKRYNFNALAKINRNYYVPKGDDYSGCVCEVFNELNIDKIYKTMEELVSKVEGEVNRLEDLRPAFEEVKKLWRV